MRPHIRLLVLWQGIRLGAWCQANEGGRIAFIWCCVSALHIISYDMHSHRHSQIPATAVAAAATVASPPSAEANGNNKSGHIYSRRDLKLWWTHIFNDTIRRRTQYYCRLKQIANRREMRVLIIVIVRLSSKYVCLLFIRKIYLKFVFLLRPLPKKTQPLS